MHLAWKNHPAKTILFLLVVLSNCTHVSVHRSEAAAGGTHDFAHSYGFSIAEALPSNAVPVAAAAVLDVATGLRVLCVAFRACTPDRGMHYALGMLDLEARQFVCVARCTLDLALPATQHMLADGPLLCVTTPAALTLVRPRGLVGDDGAAEDDGDGDGACAADVLSVRLPCAGVRPLSVTGSRSRIGAHGGSAAS